MSKSKKDPPDPVDAMLEKLLGPVEEMSEAELDELLAEAGIDVQAAARALYEKASDMRAVLWKKNVDVPSHLTSLLGQLRPADLPTSDPDVAQRAAGKWIKNLITARPAASGELAFAARGRDGDGALSEHDDQVRRELEREVEMDIKSEND